MSVSDISTLSQCFSYLALDELRLSIADYRVQKLFASNTLKAFLTAHLCKWDSLRTIASEINGKVEIQKALNLESISFSQLSRGIEKISPHIAEALFLHTCSLVQGKTDFQRINGLRLAILDSTNVPVPPLLADWAYVTRHRSGIKIHTQIALTSAGEAYPERIVLSTGNVSDYEGSDEIVIDSNALYVMDRGYVCYRRMDGWLSRKIDFVVRVNHHHLVDVLEEYEVPAEASHILRDVKVKMGGKFRWMNEPVRLVEFVDGQGRLYRIATSRYDLKAEQIADIYRKRWQIELFFRWIKGNLKTVKLYSYKPETVWTHIFLALTAYVLTMLVKLETNTKKSLRDVIRELRVHLEKTWCSLLEALHRTPKRKSSGRRSTGKPVPELQARLDAPAIIKQPRKRRR